MAQESKSPSFFPTVVVSSDGATGLELTEYIGAQGIRHQDAKAFYFRVRHAPGADPSKLAVVFDGSPSGTWLANQLGMPHLANEELAFTAASMAAIGDSLDENRLPPLAGPDEPSAMIQCFSEKFEEWKVRRASGDEQIETYLRGHLYWSWRFDHSQWVLRAADAVRLATSLDEFGRLLSVGEGHEWTVVDQTETGIVLEPTQQLLRSEKESRARTGAINVPRPQSPVFDSGVDEEETVEEVPDRHLEFHLEVSTSSGFEIQREPLESQHVPLDTDQYAAALEKVIRSARGDFMFALLGPWGRGKTYLAKQIARRLREGDTGNEHYAVAWFSAWKYPRTPETWVHLYQTFLTTVPSDFSGRMGVLLRQNLSKHGIWPAVGVTLALAITIMPLWLKLDLIGWAVSAVGVAGLVVMSTWVGGLQKAYKALRRRYLMRETYDAHLGLQSAIGEDLRHLLRAVIPRGSVFGPGQTGLVALIIVVLAVTVALAALLSASLWATITGLAMWALIVAGLRHVSMSAGRGVGRILLVMDDLDRCDTQQQTAIIEAVRLLLEDEEIHDRVQVLVLAEEEAIRHSVLARYSHVPGLERHRRTERLLFEVFEKLFIGHLRLPPLSEKSVREMAKGVLHGRVFPPSPEPSPSADAVEEVRPEAPARNDAPEQPDATGVEEVQESEQISLEGQPASSDREHRRYIYTRAEETALEQAVVSLATVTGVPTTPRAVRSFAIRYQLARELLAIGMVPGPDEICEALLEGYRVRYGRKGASDLDALARQLTVLI